MTGMGIFDVRWSGARSPLGVSTRAVRRVRREWGEELRLEVKGPDVGLCGVQTPGWKEKGPWCERWAGERTWHAGAGKCARHGGGKGAGAVEGMMMMVHAFARFEEVTPWEALLREVSRSNGAVEWLQRKVGEAPDDDALLSGGSHGEWVEMWIEQRKHALNVYKATMAIGVEKLLVEQNRIDGERMAQVLMAGLEAADMSEEQRALAAGAMRAALEAQSARERVRKEIDGSGTGEGV